MMRLGLLRLGLLLWLGGAGMALAQPAPARVGPSFTCPVVNDPLGRLICGNPELAEQDLALVQAFLALRQQSAAEEQGGLRQEAAAFSKSVRSECSIAAGPAAAETADCVGRAYARQRATWAGRLSGAARQEAGRPLAQHVALQHSLEQLGLLPQGDGADGVYGSKTRTAIVTFQQTMGLATTGLLGDADAAALDRQTAAAPAAPSTAWSEFQREATAIGVSVAIVSGDACTVTAEIREPAALRRATLDATRHAGEDPPDDDDAAALLAAEVALLRSQFATRMVHAFFATDPSVAGPCRFELASLTLDLFGRDASQTLFSFGFDRATYDKVVWQRFDPANLAKIALGFEYSEQTKRELGLGGAH